MKIIEHGECYDYELNGKIRCSGSRGCGCLFEYEESDFKEYTARDTLGRRDYMIRELFCPECGESLIVKQELIGEF